MAKINRKTKIEMIRMRMVTNTDLDVAAIILMYNFRPKIIFEASDNRWFKVRRSVDDLR